MRKQIEKLAFEHKSKLHLVAYSFSGIDCRVALSMFGGDEYVESLTTIASPHKGMKLIDDVASKSD